MNDNAGELLAVEYRLLNEGTLKLGAAGDGVRRCCDVESGGFCGGDAAEVGRKDSRCLTFGLNDACTKLRAAPGYVEAVGRLSEISCDMSGISTLSLSGESLGDDPREVDIVFVPVDAYDCLGLSLNRSR